MRPRVLVLGGGFGGLYTALHLRRRLRPRDAEITLVDRNPHFLFTPLLHQVAGGSLAPGQVARPLRPLLGPRVEVATEEVVALDPERRVVATTAAERPYDLLVLALGATTNYYGNEAVARRAFPFKTLDDAIRLREHVERLLRDAAALDDPAARAAVLTFVVAGAGCTGLELVTEIHDLVFRDLLPRAPSVRPGEVTLILAEAMDRVLCPMDPVLARQAMAQLERRRITLRLGAFVESVDDRGVVTREPSGAEARISARTLIWTAGIRATPLVAGLGLPTGPGGRLLVERTLRVPGAEGVLALGDCAAVPGDQGFYPQTAQVAVQQARTAARNVTALLRGEPLRAFRYRPRGELVSLGRLGALANAFGLRLAGFPAWLLWRTYYLGQFPEWGDRVQVAWSWAKELTRAGERP